MAESNAEVDGFDKEGTLLVALPSSHSLLGSGKIKKVEGNLNSKNKMYISTISQKGTATE